MLCRLWAWQFSKLQHTAELHGWTKFVTMQNQYNLIYREEEREMLPLCLDQGVGVIPWSPLARGKLTRDLDATTTRLETDEYGKRLYSVANIEIIERVAEIAEARGVSRAAVGLAWVSRHPAVSAPIVGFTKPHHLDDAVASLDVQLTDEEVASLEAPYTPQPVPPIWSTGSPADACAAMEFTRSRTTNATSTTNDAAPNIHAPMPTALPSEALPKSSNPSLRRVLMAFR